MIFNSLVFVVFFAVVLIVNSLLRQWGARKIWLLLASYFFYAAWNPPFVVLLWLSTVVDWFVGKAMAKAEDKKRKRGLLFISLGVNLGLLAYFKYAGFIVASAQTLLGFGGIAVEWGLPDIILPMGISFYTFQTLSYTIDIYRGNGTPWKSPLDFALFVTFFPQLVAGPIVRASDFRSQCEEERRPDRKKLGWGLSLLTIGLFEKVVLADKFMAPSVDAVYFHEGGLSLADSWASTLAFSSQIYFDFAGYSLCAIGAAMCLGFSIPDNFRFPYAAIGFSDFWRRWHISLSSWLRDYLYISLGGNRCSAVRTQFNLAATMLLGGLWHGAAWTFVVWGGLHGFYLILERQLKNRFGGGLWLKTLWARLLLAWGTYLLVLFTWVFFRAPNFKVAWAVIVGMLGFGGDSSILSTQQIVIPLAVSGLLLAKHWLLRDSSLESAASRLHWALRGLIMGVLLVAIIQFAGDSRAFIYFQF